MASFKEEMIQAVRDQVGDSKVICGLSGGVDSSVAAVLIHEAIGDQLTCVYVDTGMMRKGESDQVTALFRDHYDINLIHVDAGDEFLTLLKGVKDPEKKQALSDEITAYREGYSPLLVPLTLINHHLKQFPNQYLSDQVYLTPHPKELKLRYGY